MTKKKEIQEQAQGIEDGALEVLLDEETIRGRMGAISNRMEAERRELRDAYRDLTARKHRVWLAAHFMRDELFTSDEAKKWVLDFKMLGKAPIEKDKTAIVGIELENEEARYKLAEMAVEASNEDFDKLSKQLMWYQSVMKNNGPAVPMGYEQSIQASMAMTGEPRQAQTVDEIYPPSGKTLTQHRAEEEKAKAATGGDDDLPF